MIYPPGLYIEMIELSSAVADDEYGFTRMPFHPGDEDILDILFQIFFILHSVDIPSSDDSPGTEMCSLYIPAVLLMSGNKNGNAVADMTDDDRRYNPGSESFRRSGQRQADHQQTDRDTPFTNHAMPPLRTDNGYLKSL